MNCAVVSIFIVVGSLLSACATQDNARSADVRDHALIPTDIVVEQPGEVIETNGSFYVGKEEELVFTGSTEIRARGPIIIDGVLTMASPNEPGADGFDLVLSSLVGIVINGDLRLSAGADGELSGRAGGAAGRLEMHAPLIVTKSQIQAPAGGDGGPGGRGGNGGDLYISGFHYRPTMPEVPAGERDYPQPEALSGLGGNGGDGDATHRTGGAGGNAGQARPALFKELPWRVKYRHLWMLTDEEIAEARERGEIR